LLSRDEARPDLRFLRTHRVSKCVSKFIKILMQFKHVVSKALSLVSTRAVQLPQKPVQPKTCCEANKYQCGDTKPPLLCKPEQELQDHTSGLSWLLFELFLDEVDSNAYEDGDQDSGGYPPSPSREALHKIDPQDPINIAAYMVRSQALLLKAQCPP